MISMAVGVAVVIWCIVVSLRARKFPRGPDKPMWGEASWVGVQLLAFSMSYWFFSVNRATLLWFPLWIMLGRWVAGPSKVSALVHKLLVAAAFTRGNRAHGVVELVVFHRAMGELGLCLSLFETRTGPRHWMTYADPR